MHKFISDSLTFRCFKLTELVKSLFSQHRFLKFKITSHTVYCIHTNGLTLLTKLCEKLYTAAQLSSIEVC